MEIKKHGLPDLPGKTGPGAMLGSGPRRMVGGEGGIRTPVTQRVNLISSSPGSITLTKQNQITFIISGFMTLLLASCWHMSVSGHGQWAGALDVQSSEPF